MKKRKYVAPIVVAAIIILYYAGIAAVFSQMAMTLWQRMLLIAVPLIPCGVVIYVLVQRIREIKGGEEDDLEKY